MKKGFTLIELIAVIGIISIILLIAVPSYSLISNRIKETMHNAKIEEILAKGENYAEQTGMLSFSVNTLMEEGYLSADNETGSILDPRNKRKMNCDIIEVKYDNENYDGTYIESDECLSDDEINNRFGIIKLIVKNDEENIVESPSSWHSSKFDTISYEVNEGYESFQDKITRLEWFGEENKVCTIDNLSDCSQYLVNAYDVKSISVHLNVVFAYNDKEVSKTYTVLLSIDNQKPSLVSHSLILDNEIATNNLRKVTFELTDYNGSGVSSFSISKNKACDNYEEANDGMQTKYLNDGDYYLCIKDKAGNENNDFDNNKITVAEIDESIPRLSFTIESLKNGYNAKEVRLHLSASDDEGVENLKMCISNTAYLQNCTFENFAATKDLVLDGNYDGSSKTVYITVMDKAGNLVFSSRNYTLYKSCTKKTDWEEVSNTKSSCPSCGNANYTINYKNKDAYLGTDCETKSETKSCGAKSCIEYRYRYVQNATTTKVSSTPIRDENKHACELLYHYNATTKKCESDVCGTIAICISYDSKGKCKKYQNIQTCSTPSPGHLHCPVCSKGSVYYLGTSNIDGYNSLYFNMGIDKYAIGNCDQVTDLKTDATIYVVVGYYTCLSSELTCPSGYTLSGNKCYSKWSEWSSEPITGKDNIEVDTRTP